MIRARFLIAATVVAMSIPAGVALLAQTPPVPDLQPVLAGRNITPPFKGEAQIQVQWPPATHRDKDNVITQIRIKNLTNGPLKGFTVDQPWYDKNGAVVASATVSVNGLFEPNEVQTLTLELPYHTGMDRNNYLFKHANGTVKKPETVAKIDAPAAMPDKKK
ncbi:MAG TPA: hypothetical protein VHZ73_02345 [Vicinamibacterales bacterium]|jgi:hypothetical protein|nr:hypothetical protein [Vicinamibacterales bacterium]